MTNQAARMLGSALVAAGGVIAHSLAGLEKGDQAEIFATLATLLGGTLFMMDWVASWRGERAGPPTSAVSPKAE